MAASRHVVGKGVQETGKGGVAVKRHAYSVVYQLHTTKQLPRRCLQSALEASSSKSSLHMLCPMLLPLSPSVPWLRGCHLSTPKFACGGGGSRAAEETS